MAESARLKNFGGVVRGGEIYQGKQGLDYTPGVSAETVGSQALWLGTVPLPPGGGRTKAHLHENHESAFYFISGENVEVYTGEHIHLRDHATVVAELLLQTHSITLPLSRVRGREILGSPHGAECVGHLALRHLLVQLRSHHHALLLVGIGPRPDEHRRRLAAIDNRKSVV